LNSNPRLSCASPGARWHADGFIAGVVNQALHHHQHHVVAQDIGRVDLLIEERLGRIQLALGLVGRRRVLAGDQVIAVAAIEVADAGVGQVELLDLAIGLAWRRSSSNAPW
jgi:hypothetical protein